jgi:hypothetical protein
VISRWEKEVTPAQLQQALKKDAVPEMMVGEPSSSASS